MHDGEMKETSQLSPAHRSVGLQSSKVAQGETKQGKDNVIRQIETSDFCRVARGTEQGKDTVIRQSKVAQGETKQSKDNVIRQI